MRSMRTYRLKARGFTLLELLITISIIIALSAMAFKVYGGIIRNSRKLKAALQVQAIAEAAQQYFNDFKVFPPDTGIYEKTDPPPTGLDGDSCKYAIHRYLGMVVTDTMTGLQFGPYLRDLKDGVNLLGEESKVDGKPCRLYSDPWGQPYELDCKHWSRDPKTRVVTVTMPYPDGTPEDQMTLEIKVWSSGPDGKKSDAAQFYPYTINNEDKDNIMSWTK